MVTKNFDIVVIGGGHAGLEAAQIASQWGHKIAIFSMPGVALASTPCNPSIGGVAKGQVVREIDALGGLMGKLADLSAIQFRTLNDSKGYAVQSTRVQVDKERYSAYAESLIQSIPNISLISEKVEHVQKEGDLFLIQTALSERITAKKVIITAGTFLNGKLHCGSLQSFGGRIDNERSQGLNTLLSQIKMHPLRFKTGTPPRLKKESVHFDRMEPQYSDEQTRNFHLLHHPYQRHLPQVCCYLTRTNPKTLEIIRSNKDKSPLFNGQIQGVGPRYCPSIEDKAYRYPDRDEHHLFIEPEGLELDTIYPNGLSTSLPQEVQKQFVNSIVGLEAAEIAVPGYAVEYDVVDTTNLNQALEHHEIKGLYFAGQVNGTSGYEEAAGQGIVAGINASLSLLGREPLYLSRHHSYIGVMIEDLISNRRDEPYRLFTARSENRLHLREDNTLLRMAPYRLQLGLATTLDRYILSFLEQYDLLMDLCDEHCYLDQEKVRAHFDTYGYGELGRASLPLSDLLKRPQLDPIATLAQELSSASVFFAEDVIRTVAITKRYEGYVRRSEEQNRRMENLDQMRINWSLLSASTNISFECRQRIQKIKPETFGQLRLIEGIRAATLAIAAGKLY